MHSWPRSPVIGVERHDMPTMAQLKALMDWVETSLSLAGISLFIVSQKWASIPYLRIESAKMQPNDNNANIKLLGRQVSLHARLTDSFVASVGYLFTYYNSKVTEERKARIERINLQVSTNRLTHRVEAIPC